VSSVSGIAIFEKFFMNCWLKLANLMKACTSLTVVGVGYSLMTLIFSGLILTLSLLTIWPRNSTSFWCYLHLLGSTNRWCCCSSVRILYMCSLCSFLL
jgi:hypothetical protein